MTIDEIIDRLTAVTAWARDSGSKHGYFAALYRTVTIEVKRGIAEGRFEDGPRMERLDVIFARRYLDAFENRRRGLPTSRAWRIAFDAVERWRPIVLQHLLVGMNAHINLDLGIAAAAVAPGAELSAIRRDFDEINVILGGLMAGVESQIGTVSPWIDFASTAAGNLDGVLAGFNMRIARRVAWDVATKLAPLEGEALQSQIDSVDLAASLLGRAILHPPLLTSAALFVVRCGERSTVRDVIDILCEVHPLPYSLAPDEQPAA